jgi:hypothetical protein
MLLFCHDAYFNYGSQLVSYTNIYGYIYRNKKGHLQFRIEDGATRNVTTKETSFGYPRPTDYYQPIMQEQEKWQCVVDLRDFPWQVLEIANMTAQYLKWPRQRTTLCVLRKSKVSQII